MVILYACTKHGHLVQDSNISSNMTCLDEDARVSNISLFVLMTLSLLCFSIPCLRGYLILIFCCILLFNLFNYIIFLLLSNKSVKGAFTSLMVSTNLFQAFLRHIDFNVVRCAVIASPGFTKVCNYSLFFLFGLIYSQYLQIYTSDTHILMIKRFISYTVIHA